jgi:lysophospholipase L1-like esterase
MSRVGISRTSGIGWQIAGAVGCVLTVIALALAILGSESVEGVAASQQPQDLNALNPLAETYAPDDFHRKVVVIGDSFTDGTDEGGRGAQGWPALVWNRLEAQGLSIEPTVDATGGSGYVSPGPSDLTFLDEIKRSVTAEDDLVVMFGGTNDSGLPVDDLMAAAQKAIEAVQSRAPSASVIMVGPVWPESNPSTSVVAVNEALRAVALSEGVRYVDAIGEQWLAATPELIGPDGVHPTDGGHRYLADRLGAVIGTALTMGRN